MKTNRVIAAACVVSVAAAAPVFAGHRDGEELPPGLEKKVERGGRLPPGWQKKVHVGEPLHPDIYEAGVVIADDEGLLTVRIEGKLIRLIEETREVIQILD